METQTAQGASPAKAGVREKSQLMSASEIDRTLVRLAHEVAERHNGTENLVFVGIRRRGVPLASRLAEKIAQIEKKVTPVGILDITFYRDDLSKIDQKPVVQASNLAFSVEGKDVILTDDVLYTGRTIRAALNELFDFGRPRAVRLAVLADRGGRELPVAAGFVGARVQMGGEEELVLSNENGKLRLAALRRRA